MLRGLLPLAVLLVVWQLTASEDSLTFPPPSTWPGALADMQDEGTLLPAIATTIETFAIAMVVSTVLGVALGMLIGGSMRLERALTPLMDFFRTLPPPAIVPVLALLLGANKQMAVAVVVLAAIWPILLNTVTAMRSVPPVRLEMARSLGLSRGDRLRKVVYPSLAPGIVLGVRVSVSIALIVTLLVDILGTGEGVGRELLVAQQTFEPAKVWALLLLVGIFGYLMSAAAASGEDRIWRQWGERR
jgi:ABC-type nitrate/sulfonate/bicarbonate transport system permease component